MNKAKEFYEKYISIEIEPLNKHIFWLWGIIIVITSIIDVCAFFNYISRGISIVLSIVILWVANYIYIKFNDNFYSKRRRRKAMFQITLLSIILMGIKIYYYGCI